MANQQPLSLDQGSDKTLSYTIYLDSVSSNNLLNLTGYSANFQISKSLGSAPILLIDASSGISIQASTITVEIRSSATSALKFMGDTFIGVYQLEIKSPDNKIYRVAEGAVTINKEIIRVNNITTGGGA